MRRAIAGALIGSLATLTVVVSAAAPVPTAEVVRIRAHFDSVLAELRVRDVSALSSKQRPQRTALVHVLTAYRDRGVFPNNYDFPGAAVPYFVDRKTGTRCAVAHLLESAGRHDIVVRVRRVNNNVWVAELGRDTAFVGWLDAHGLSLEEAARIQVPYIDPQPAQAQVAVRKSNLQTRAAIGAASLATFYFSTRGYLRHRQTLAARRQTAKLRIAISPIVSPTDGAGLSFTFRF